MDTTRVREELGWAPQHSPVDATRDVLSGIADAEGEPTPPLETAAADSSSHVRCQAPDMAG